MTKTASRPSLYQRIWRWHFFAGLFVAPFAIVLAITGAIYLFTPQINGLTERSVHRQIPASEAGDAKSPSQVLAALLRQHSDYKFHRLQLAKQDDPTYEIELKPKGPARHLAKKMVWVSVDSGQVVASDDPDSSVPKFVKRIHGELLSGDVGSLLVELVASWFMVLMITGLYLYWPRHMSWRSVFFPSLARRGRPLLLALHGSIAAWSSLVILLFLLSGLPWTQVWGAGFSWVQDRLGVPDQGQEFRVTLKSNSESKGVGQSISLEQVMRKSEQQSLKPPVFIQPPKTDGVWTIRSLHPNRANRVTIHYDQWSGKEVLRINFADKHWFKRLVGHGISLHEGHLFGPLNQALGVLVALCVIAISVTGPLMWWRRRPRGELAAPLVPVERIPVAVMVAMFALAAFLPLVALSIVLIVLVDIVYVRLRWS